MELLLADALGVAGQDLVVDLVDGPGDGGEQLLPAHTQVLGGRGRGGGLAVLCAGVCVDAIVPFVFVCAVNKYACVRLTFRESVSVCKSTFICECVCACVCVCVRACERVTKGEGDVLVGHVCTLCVYISVTSMV